MAIALLLVVLPSQAYSATGSTSQLADAPSAFLRKYAQSQVNWLPWGDEAVTQAVREKKPLFLAVGSIDNEFSRAMHQNSFSNPEVAAFFNKHFICVLIDREERPDIAELYQGWVRTNRQLIGWPLNIWLTPDLKPFEGATYLPPSEEWGKEGVITVATRVATLWETNPNGARNKAKDGIARTSDQVPDGAPAGIADSETLQKKLDAAATVWVQTVDAENGGFGTAPKHPEPELLRFLLTRKGPGAESSLAALRALVRGALHDQVGGGFFRYTSDAAWRMPIFQKTLLNQARIALALADGVEASGDPELADALRSTLDMIATDFSAIKGGYITSLDATTDETMPYFVWTSAEITEVLGADRAPSFLQVFHAKTEGNVPAEDDPSSRLVGKNILYRIGALDASQLDQLQSDRAKLRAAQSRHVQVLRDESVQAGPNGLVIAAFARGSTALKQPRYLDLARKQWSFLKTTGVAEKGNPRVMGDPNSIPLPADLLLIAEGLSVLSSVTKDKEIATTAKKLVLSISQNYLDPKTGRFFASMPTKAPEFYRRPYCTERNVGEAPAPESLIVALLASMPEIADSNILPVKYALAAQLESPEPVRGDVLLALALGCR